MRVARALVASLLALSSGAFAAAPKEAKGAAPRAVELGGRLVSALAASEDELFVLVAPTREVDGARRLLRVALDGDRPVTELARGLGGWTKTLAAVELDGRIELVAGGLGRLASLGPLESPAADESSLVDHPGFDLRSLAPSRLRAGIERELVAAEVGALRIWKPKGGALALAEEIALPFRIERESEGLRLVGAPVAELPRDAAGRRRFAVGPEAIGARLRVVLVEQAEEGWRRSEAWCALPGAESVEESWLGAVDGAPALLAHTQGAVEMNVFEDQLWRLCLLAPDPSRAGRAPSLAVALDSKRWHDNRALLADVDRDGATDVLIVRPEGVTGTDLVIEVFAGKGGRIESRSRRTDLDKAPSRYQLLADSDGTGQPGLVTLDAGELTLRRFERDPKRVLERAPLAHAGWTTPERKETEPGDDGDRRWSPLEWLGAAPRAGRPPRLLVLIDSGDGSDRLLIVEPAGR